MGQVSEKTVIAQCPCGGYPANRKIGSDTHYMVCFRCNRRGPECVDVPSAIAEWNLIASAGDLLASLRDAACWLRIGNFKATDSKTKMMGEFADACLAAIAKVEGREP